MKLFCTATLLFIGVTLRAQEQRLDSQGKPLEITINKTSTLVFTSAIKSVDRGSRDILAQKTKEVGNVLQLKAAKRNFAETNLTVITADGSLHQFTVNYCEEPSTLITEITGEQEQSPHVRMMFATDMTETTLEEYSRGIIASKRVTHFRNTSRYKISLSLLGIYVRDNVIFYRLRIQNHSNINYDIELLKFFVRDNAKIKRTASQEVESKPLYVFDQVDGALSTIKGKSEAEMVFALEKFTIPESKHLAVELFEYKGGRHFQLKIKNKDIVNARLLP